jgi:hypothetical protein
MVIVMLVACLLVGRVARAQEAVQDPRVGDAKTACVAGEVQKGIRLLAELYTASNDPIWIFNQGRCYHQNVQLAQALARFKEFLRKSKGAPDEDIRDARNYIAEIEAELHRQEQAAREKAETTGDKLPVSVQNRPKPPEPGQGLRYTGVGVSILGGASLAAGIVFSILIRQTQKSVENRTANDIVDGAAIKGKDDDGHRYETLQWISYGVGAAAVATGSVLYWLGTRSGNPQMAGTCVSPLFFANGAGASVHMAF